MSDLYAHLRRRDRWRWGEVAFWLALLVAVVVFPSRAALVNEALIAGLFALSLDLILGLAGVVSLGHAAFFGLGAYTAAILANAGYDDPLLGLAAAILPCAVVGLATAPLLLRGADLTRLMVTMGVALMLGELANKLGWLTGGADGLNFSVAPLFGVFTIGSIGEGPRNAALFSGVVLFLLFTAARRLRSSPFGVSLEAMRENRLRAGALGVSTSRRLIAVYVVSAVYAGIAGALLALTTQIASLDLFDFHRSADVMLMLIIGGAGWLYGGIVGAGVFIVIRDAVSAQTPEYWEFWIGLMMVVLVLVGRDRIAGWFGEGPMSAPALEARGLVRRFGGLLATDNVSLCLAAGARQALIGPNGAGKTTLINLLTGVIKPTEGAVLLEGRDVTAMSSSRRVRLGLARTFQINQLFPDLSPAESLGLAISEREGRGADFWRPAGRREIVGEIEELLTRFGLAEVATLPTRSLAYGKQRLLEIALALACRPRVLLLDEPAAGVPEEERHDILAALAALPAEVAILLIEHDMDLVFSFATRISVLVAGRLLCEGTPAEIAADERVRAVYLGEDGG